jgi:DNA invertase Pin-like site-specific DNA recombinase
VTFGYARVSTEDQNPAMQAAALLKAECHDIYKDEGKSGATMKKRPALAKVLKRLQPGDTLVVWKLDRLTRSLKDLFTIFEDLEARGIHFRSLTESIDTETPTGRAMWQMIGVFAELERNFIAERTREGIKAARKRGVRFGRKRALAGDKLKLAKQLHRQGQPLGQIASSLEVHRSTLYRRLKA